jgi:hypothetical protein
MSPHTHGSHALTAARRARLLSGTPGGQGWIGRDAPAPDPRTAVHRTIAPPPPALHPVAQQPGLVPVHLAAGEPTYRRSLWPVIAVLSVLVALLSVYAWTLTETRLATATQIARAGR